MRLPPYGHVICLWCRDGDSSGRVPPHDCPRDNARAPTKRQLAELRLARDLADIHRLWEPGRERTQRVNAFVDLYASKDKP